MLQINFRTPYNICLVLNVFSLFLVLIKKFDSITIFSSTAFWYWVKRLTGITYKVCLIIPHGSYKVVYELFFLYICTILISVIVISLLLYAFSDKEISFFTCWSRILIILFFSFYILPALNYFA